MTRMIVKANVGAAGVLHLDVPLGMGWANSEVKVTIEPIVNVPDTTTNGEWLDWLKTKYGTWQGPFARAEPLELEERMSLNDPSA